MSCTWSVVLLTQILGTPSSAHGQKPSQIPSQIAGQELLLANAQSLYIVVDTIQNIVLLKARGIPLRTFKLKETGWIGDVFTQPTIIHLTSKNPLISPLPIIPPQAPSSSSLNDQSAVPLTVTDMPYRYDLTFQENLTILVQPSRLQGFWANVVHQIAGWSQRVAANMGTRAKSHHYLVMIIDPAEAQALYWATIPPMNCLILTELPSGQ